MDELRVVDCCGGPLERGRAHGEEVRSDLREFYASWIEAACRESGVAERELVSGAETLLPACREYCADLLDEVEGIATGAGMEFGSIFLINCYDEVDLHGQALTKAALHGCTSFAATGRATRDDRVYIGQGWDTPLVIRPYLLRLTGDDQPDVLVVSHAGMVGGTGINEHGLAICWNSLKARDVRPGVPVPFVVRKALQATELAELVGNVIRAPRANGMNLVAADAETAVDIELSATRFHVTYSDGILAHANHFEAPELLEFEADYPLRIPDTLLRSGRMKLLLEKKCGSIDREALQLILADHSGGPGSICRHQEARGMQTQVAVLYDPAERALWASNGNPCSQPFLQYSLLGERRDQT